LLAGAASIGAVLGGASDADSRKIYRYALELGLAFQLQDDLLDSYGREEELGKKIGGDILEGKKTCLMQHAMSHASEEDREILRTTYLDNTLSDDEKIARVKAVYERYDVSHAILRMISTRFERAIAILDTLGLDSVRTEHLRIYAENLMNRKK
jgi:geranylgeranyl diphosphate synthase type II